MFNCVCQCLLILGTCLCKYWILNCLTRWILQLHAKCRKNMFPQTCSGQKRFAALWFCKQSLGLVSEPHAHSSDPPRTPGHRRFTSNVLLKHDVGVCSASQTTVSLLDTCGHADTVPLAYLKGYPSNLRRQTLHRAVERTKRVVSSILLCSPCQADCESGGRVGPKTLTWFSGSHFQTGLDENMPSTTILPTEADSGHIAFRDFQIFCFCSDPAQRPTRNHRHVSFLAKRGGMG